MNDTENHVQLVIDEDVLKGEYVGCHPCINTSSLRVRTADLMEKIIPAMHHEAKIIQISPASFCAGAVPGKKQKAWKNRSLQEHLW